MGESAHVKSVQAIADFKTDLKTFGYEAGQLLQDIARKIIQTREWLEERQRYWQYQVERCKEMVRQAQRALEHCHSEDDRDCSAYEERLHEAYRYLRKAEEELQNVRLWKGRVEQAVADYQKQAYRLGSQLTNDVPKADAFLETVIVKLQEYIAVSPIAGESAGSISGQTVSKPSVKTAEFGHAETTDYKKTFFDAYPHLEGKVVVHHAVEQQVLTRYPGVVTESELHSLQNLRGIPNELNPDLHLSKIRKEWNRFYKKHPKATKVHLLQKAAEIDETYGKLYNPEWE